MALFDYQALDDQGKSQKGRIDAPNLKTAKQNLHQKGLLVHQIKEVRDRASLSFSSAPKTPQAQKVPGPDLARFTRQFATLQATAIPYDKALEIMILEGGESPMNPVMSTLKSKITEGQNLAQAMEAFPKVFPRMYVAMVRAGEAGGTLSKVLDRLANFLEEQEEIKSKTQGAMIYPVIMIVLGFGIMVFMLTFILPKITPIFEQFNVELPLPTRMVMAASDLVTTGWWALILLLVGGFYGYQRFAATKEGEYRIHQLWLRLPIIRTILQKIYQYRFAQTLAVLMGSGVDLKQSLTILSRVIGNQVYERKLLEMSEDITQKGLSLSQALKKTDLFPPSLLQMIRVGEESSQLEAMLDKVGMNLEKEVARNLSKALALLEPMMILLMAVMVGFIVLAVMLPMFELNQLL